MSIRAKLLLSILFAVTVTVSAFELMSVNKQRAMLISNRKADYASVIRRLSIVLPLAVYDFAFHPIKKAIEAEVFSDNLAAILVVDSQNQIIVGLSKDEKGMPVKILELPKPVPDQSTNLFYGDKKKRVGKVLLYRDDRSFNRSMAQLVLDSIVHVFILNLTILLLVGIIIDRIIRRPLTAMIGRLKNIAEGDGDLTKRMDDRGRDEIAEVARWFNMFIGKIEGIVLQVKNGALSIDTSAVRIIASAQEQATGATEQSSAVSEASTTVMELATTATMIADSAESVAKIAERTLIGMQEIHTKVEAIAKKILSLGEKSKSIENITKLIHDIADQSDLLALNGAIEAARVGEAGTGFAVVAQEMRKLAELSSESTKEIRQLITTIQTETKSTVVGIGDSTKWVGKGLEMVMETARSAKEISMATQQQRSASAQTVQVMHSINTVTKQFAATTQQTLASAEQLEKLSQELRKAVGCFKLHDSGFMPNQEIKGSTQH